MTGTIEKIKNKFRNTDTESWGDDKFTKRDFIICIFIFIGMLCIYNFASFMIDKARCTYKGYTYEKNTKRPIFSECLIQMKDGSYVPLERYINRVLTFNDLGQGE